MLHCMSKRRKEDFLQNLIFSFTDGSEMFVYCLENHLEDVIFT